MNIRGKMGELISQKSNPFVELKINLNLLSDLFVFSKSKSYYY